RFIRRLNSTRWLLERLAAFGFIHFLNIRSSLMQKIRPAMEAAIS
ncbi:unnamed protein product, partial [Brugia pahangi]|uniref:IS6 family transposase n=1 Tax=Brugia pahangi TaxID=6280 RepID=A0A0N4T2C1_BRUPA